MEYQNQENSEDQVYMPTSVGGSKDHQKEETGNNANVISDDATSRLRDESKEEAQPQIDEEGGFKSKAGWTRTEGLSDEERGNAEEEDLNGRHSGDNSIL